MGFLERVARHYQAAGWSVRVRPALEGPRPFQPDLFVKKGFAELAVLVREEPPGPFEVAEFGAQCKKRKLRGAVVCPEDARVLELADQAGLDFVAGETIGDVTVLGDAPPPPPIETARPAPAPVQVPVAAATANVHRPRWWRWAVVAVIWAAALTLLGIDLWRWLNK